MGWGNDSSVFCGYDYYKTEEKALKHNWDYSLGLHIAWSKNSWTDKSKCPPAFIVQSNMPIAVNNGAFGIKMGVIGMTSSDSQEGTWCGHNGCDGTAFTSWKAELRVGNMYWNGSSWTSTKSTFTLQTGNEEDSTSTSGEGQAISKKDVDADPQGCEGTMVSVPKTTYLYGKVSLKVFNRNIYAISGGGVYTNLVFLKDISVKWYPTVREINESENVYKSLACSNAKEDKEVTLDLASWNNNKFGHGIIVNIANHYINQMVPAPANIEDYQTPEELLRARMVSLYSKPRRRLTVSLPISQDLNYMVIYSYDSCLWSVQNKSYNYRDGIVAVTLYNIR